MLPGTSESIPDAFLDTSLQTRACAMVALCMYMLCSVWLLASVPVWAQTAGDPPGSDAAAWASSSDGDKALPNMRELGKWTRAQEATLQGLNKITARVVTIDTQLKKVYGFGTLGVMVHSCWSAPPDERPESVALIEVRERLPDGRPSKIFFGWMFASSPGLSGMEHPMYDLTLTACK